MPGSAGRASSAETGVPCARPGAGDRETAVPRAARTTRSRTGKDEASPRPGSSAVARERGGRGGVGQPRRRVIRARLSGGCVGDAPAVTPKACLRHDGRQARADLSYQRPVCLTGGASRTRPWGKGRAPRGPHRLPPDRNAEVPAAPRPVRSPGGASRRARGVQQRRRSGIGTGRPWTAREARRPPEGPARPDRRGSIGQKRPPARCGMSHRCGPLVSPAKSAKWVRWRRARFRGSPEKRPREGVNLFYQ